MVSWGPIVLQSINNTQNPRCVTNKTRDFIICETNKTRFLPGISTPRHARCSPSHTAKINLNPQNEATDLLLLLPDCETAPDKSRAVESSQGN